MDEIESFLESFSPHIWTTVSKLGRRRREKTERKPNRCDSSSDETSKRDEPIFEGASIEEDEDEEQSDTRPTDLNRMECVECGETIEENRCAASYVACPGNVLHISENPRHYYCLCEQYGKKPVLSKRDGIRLIGCPKCRTPLAPAGHSLSKTWLREIDLDPSLVKSTIPRHVAMELSDCVKDGMVAVEASVVSFACAVVACGVVGISRYVIAGIPIAAVAFACCFNSAFPFPTTPSFRGIPQVVIPGSRWVDRTRVFPVVFATMACVSRTIFASSILMTFETKEWFGMGRVFATVVTIFFVRILVLGMKKTFERGKAISVDAAHRCDVWFRVADNIINVNLDETWARSTRIWCHSIVFS